jgi:catechol 2,3-dioxygenase-like lactoylglutathione lyase family enzyme
MEQRISFVTLGVRDIDRARRFYESLGWSGQTPDGDVYFYQAGGMIFALWDRAKLAEDSTIESDPGGWGGVTLAYNVRSPEEVDAMLVDAETAGGTIGRRGAPTVWGGYTGIFIDPEGHPWEVAHNPGFPLLEDGSIRLP